MIEDKNFDIVTINDFLTPDQCQSMIARCEAAGFEEATVRSADGPNMMKGIRNNNRVMFNDPALALEWFDRVQKHVPPTMDCAVVDCINPGFKVYRYVPGQFFKMHRDGREPIADGVETRITMLVYLNDDCEGGETGFRGFSVKPEIGMALLFRHELDHEGAPVLSGRKYVLRSDVAYRTRTK